MYIKLNENINSGMLYAIAYCEDPDIYSEEFWGWDTESDVGYELMEFGSLIQDADVFDSLEAAEDRADDVLSSIFEDEVFIVGLDPYTPHNLTGFVKKVVRKESNSLSEDTQYSLDGRYLDQIRYSGHSSGDHNKWVDEVSKKYGGKLAQVAEKYNIKDMEVLDKIYNDPKFRQICGKYGNILWSAPETVRVLVIKYTDPKRLDTDYEKVRARYYPGRVYETAVKYGFEDNMQMVKLLDEDPGFGILVHRFDDIPEKYMDLVLDRLHKGLHRRYVVEYTTKENPEPQTYYLYMDALKVYEIEDQLRKELPRYTYPKMISYKCELVPAKSFGKGFWAPGKCGFPKKENEALKSNNSGDLKEFKSTGWILKYDNGNIDVYWTANDDYTDDINNPDIMIYDSKEMALSDITDVKNKYAELTDYKDALFTPVPVSTLRESKSIKESTAGDYVEVAYICDGFTNFRVFGGGFKTSDALVSVEDEKGKRLRLTMGDVREFYTWYDAKGNVIHEPGYIDTDTDYKGIKTITLNADTEGQKIVLTFDTFEDVYKHFENLYMNATDENYAEEILYSIMCSASANEYDYIDEDGFAVIEVDATGIFN